MYTTLSRPKVRNVALVEAAIGAGARDAGCADGPREFWQRLQGADVPGVNLRWHAMPRSVTAGDTPLRAIARVDAHLADTVENLVVQRERFIVLGGDHSCGAGTWSGAARALRRAGPIGLVWIDAHMDMHTPASTW